jgi:hypothetical protein
MKRESEKKIRLYIVEMLSDVADEIISKKMVDNRLSIWWARTLVNFAKKWPLFGDLASCEVRFCVVVWL